MGTARSRKGGTVRVLKTQKFVKPFFMCVLLVGMYSDSVVGSSENPITLFTGHKW